MTLTVDICVWLCYLQLVLVSKTADVSPSGNFRVQGKAPTALSVYRFNSPFV